MRGACLLSDDQPRAPAAHVTAGGRQRAAHEARCSSNLGQRDVQHVNRTYARSGTLSGGRFRSCLVDAEPCLLACQRYVGLNPVRAAMVRHPRQYRWSSYRFNAEGRAGGIIVPHELHRLGRSAQARHEAYRVLFQAAPEPVVVEGIRQATNAASCSARRGSRRRSRTRLAGGWSAASRGGRRERQSRQRREGRAPGYSKRGLSHYCPVVMRTDLVG